MESLTIKREKRMCKIVEGVANITASEFKELNIP